MNLGLFKFSREIAIWQKYSFTAEGQFQVQKHLWFPNVTYPGIAGVNWFWLASWFVSESTFIPKKCQRLSKGNKHISSSTFTIVKRERQNWWILLLSLTLWTNFLVKYVDCYSYFQWSIHKLGCCCNKCPLPLHGRSGTIQERADRSSRVIVVL